MDNILVTGGSGLLGSNLALMASGKFNVYAIYNTHEVAIKGVNFLKVDLTRKEDLDKIRNIAFKLIVHCAALTNVDYCEENPPEAHLQNVTATENIVELAKASGAYLVYISTDSVFDGKKGNYTEEDATNPLNVYGKTKLEAEKVVVGYENSCIVRTNIYGWNKLDKFSLAEWMIDKLEKHEELKGFEDVYFSPMLVNNLIEAIFELHQNGYKGIIHLAGSESCSKLEFAFKVADIFGLDKSLIKASLLEDLNLKAPRGKNLSLDITKAAGLLKTRLMDVDSGLILMKQLKEEGYTKRLKDG